MFHVKWITFKISSTCTLTPSLFILECWSREFDSKPAELNTSFRNGSSAREVAITVDCLDFTVICSVDSSHDETDAINSNESRILVFIGCTTLTENGVFIKIGKHRMSEQVCSGRSQRNFMMDVMTSKQALTRVASCDDVVKFFLKSFVALIDEWYL